MKMKRHLLILTLGICQWSFCAAQTQISDYQPGVTAEGAVYFLPKTALRFNIMVEKTTYKPGDFAPYAMRYLRLKDVPQEASTQYRVISIRQTAIGVADTTKRYAVKFNPKTVAANLSLAEDGRLLGINADVKDTPHPTLFKAARKPIAVNPRQFMTEEILAAGSTAKMAELTAREIYDLRENRNLLIKGQADFMPSDGAQMRLMLNQMEQQDRILTQLFAGTTTRDTTEEIIIVTPEGPLPRTVLFRLSQKLGLVDADDLAGEPYFIATEDLNTVAPFDEEAAANSKHKQPESGIYVNVAGKMRSTIYRGKEVYSTKEFPCAQFGNVELLSGNLFNKHNTTHLWLNPITGAVDKLEAEMTK